MSVSISVETSGKNVINASKTSAYRYNCTTLLFHMEQSHEKQEMQRFSYVLDITDALISGRSDPQCEPPAANYPEA